MSENGAWLVLNLWIDSEPDTDLTQVVEVSTGTAVTEFDGPLKHDLKVGDDGSVFHQSDGWAGSVSRLTPGSTRFERVFEEFPRGFARWGPFTLLGEQEAGWLGTLEDESGELEAALVVADLSDGSAQTFRLPGVRLGVVGERELDDWLAPEIIEPAVVWDTDRQRAIVVHADQPGVTIVDLVDGELNEHTWSPTTSWVDALFAWLIPTANAKGPSFGTVRDAVLSPSGDLLYVATQPADVVADGYGGWSVHSVPQDVQVINTEDWSVVAEFDIPASQVTLSPNGAHLVAAGVVTVDTSRSTGSELEDVYIIRTDTLEVVGAVDTRSLWFPDIQFSSDSTYVYLGGGPVHIVELETAEVLDVVATSERTTVFGRAAMLSTPSAR